MVQLHSQLKILPYGFVLAADLLQSIINKAKDLDLLAMLH